MTVYKHIVCICV